jgi:hypothetical protein
MVEHGRPASRPHFCRTALAMLYIAAGDEIRPPHVSRGARTAEGCAIACRRYLVMETLFNPEKSGGSGLKSRSTAADSKRE